MEERLFAFRAYAEGFLPGADEDCRTNIELKIGHTFRVRALARALAVEEEFEPRAAFLTELAALYHDLSRFEQYVKYRTFNDRISFDHGERSAELLQEMNLLADLPRCEAETVLHAVAAHNKLNLPPSFSGRELLVARALRDCDKIDIMPITIAFLKNPNNRSVVWKLPHGEHLSVAVATALKEHRSPAYADFQSELDFIASKLAWQYELGFAFSRRKFAEGRFMEQIRAFLPGTAEFDLI